MKRLRNRQGVGPTLRLTPLEIQSKTGVGKPLTNKEKRSTSVKIIRFYAVEKHREIMDDITIEDLREMGFVPYRYEGTKDPKTLLIAKVEDPKRLVHHSVPVGKTSGSTATVDYPHPVIRYETGYGWEAKWGAVRSQVGTRDLLHAFMKHFNYPIPTLEDDTTQSGTN